MRVLYAFRLPSNRPFLQIIMVIHLKTSVLSIQTIFLIRNNSRRGITVYVQKAVEAAWKQRLDKGQYIQQLTVDPSTR